MPEYTSTLSLLEFAWNSLTDQQRFRIQMKYDLVRKLDKRGDGTKMNVYRVIAEKYNYTVERILEIANKELKK